MITLADGLEYDDSLSFDEQSDEVKAHIDSIIIKEPDERPDISPVDGRPDCFIWHFRGFSVKQAYEYPYAYPRQNQRVVSGIRVYES